MKKLITFGNNKLLLQPTTRKTTQTQESDGTKKGVPLPKNISFKNYFKCIQPTVGEFLTTDASVCVREGELITVFPSYLET